MYNRQNDIIWMEKQELFINVFKPDLNDKGYFNLAKLRCFNSRVFKINYGKDKTKRHKVTIYHYLKNIFYCLESNSTYLIDK